MDVVASAADEYEVEEEVVACEGDDHPESGVLVEG